MTTSSLNLVPLYWLALPFKQLQLDRWMMLSSTCFEAWTMNEWTQMINLEFDPSYLHFSWYFLVYIALKKWVEHCYWNVSFVLLLFAMTSCYCCSRFRRTILTINRSSSQALFWQSRRHRNCTWIIGDWIDWVALYAWYVWDKFNYSPNFLLEIKWKWSIKFLTLVI